jgi:cyclic pyranopterin phosphate synthase
MPESGVEFIPHNEIISFEDIIEIVKHGIENGINKVRLTGGEPLVRKGIVSLVKSISAIKGVEDLAMTTNGVLLKQYAKQLAEAGLKRVNISLDTTDAEEFKSITRGGNIIDVFEGIEAAKEAGLFPIKINCVIKESNKEKNAVEVAEFCKQNGLQVRFIEMMNLKGGDFSVVDGGEGGDCANCNRLRLNSTGKLRPCLFSDLSFDTKTEGVSGAYKLSMDNKPKNGVSSGTVEFYNIGG